MSTQPTNFQSSSVDIAREFLRSVLVIDDQASEPETDGVSELKPPERVMGSKSERKASTKEQPPETKIGSTPSSENVQEKEETNRDTHALSIKEFSDYFAEIGVFCTVLKPAPDELDQLIAESLEEHGLANRADVLILDWVLHSYKEGEKALEL